MPVTGNDVLKSAMALMTGDPDMAPTTQQAKAALASINTMLADLFAVNNSLLLADGLPALAAAPTVTALGDALPYRDELTRNTMHFGLARDLGLPRNHSNLAYYADSYESGKFRYAKGVAEAVAGQYGRCGEEP